MAKVTINGSQAVAELDKLQKQFDELKKAQKQFQEGSKDYNDLQKQISATSSNIEAYRKKLDITGMSYKQLQRLQKDLRKDMQGLGQDTQEYANKAKELAKVNLQLKEIRKSATAVAKETGELNNKTSSFKATFLGTFAGNVATSAIQLATDAIVQFGTETFKATEDLRKLNNQLAQMGVASEDIDEVSSRIAGLSQTFGEDMNDVLIASNNLAKQFGISQNEALDLVEKGFLKGANASGDFLQKIKEYGVQFKQSGMNAEQFVKFATQEVRGGVFDDKLLDSIKEIGLRLRELTPASREALKP